MRERDSAPGQNGDGLPWKLWRRWVFERLVPTKDRRILVSEMSELHRNKVEHEGRSAADRFRREWVRRMALWTRASRSLARP